MLISLFGKLMEKAHVTKFLIYNVTHIQRAVVNL